MVYLEEATSVDLKAIKKLYKDAFPRLERKSFGLIKKKAAEGFSKILAVKDDGNFCGLMITAAFDGMMLLDYFAVSKDMRGKSIGTQALKEFLRIFSNDYRIFLEIELPNDREDDIKLKRKRFYLKNDLKQSGIEVTLFSVPMELLYYTEKVTFQEYHDLYRAVFGNIFAKKVRFIKQREDF